MEGGRGEQSWYPIGESKNKEEEYGESQRIETYRDAWSQKEIQMEPNLSVKKKKKKKSILPREKPFAGNL